MSPPLCAALAVALLAARPEPLLETAPAPRWRGTGALVVGSLAGLAGAGLGFGTARRVAAIEACADCRGQSFGLPFASVALNTAAFTLIAAGAGLRGRDDGLRRLAPRAPGLAIRLGALLLGGGGVLAAAALTWRLLDAPRGAGTSWALLQGGVSMLVAGAGLIVYGTTYRRFQIVPAVHHHHAGLTLLHAF